MEEEKIRLSQIQVELKGVQLLTAVASLQNPKTKNLLDKLLTTLQAAERILDEAREVEAASDEEEESGREGL